MAVVEIDFPGNLGQVDTIADLRGVPSYFLTDDLLYAVLDSGFFRWDPSSLASDDGVSVVKPNDRTSLQAGRWLVASDISDPRLRSDLASPDSGKGAALVAYKAPGTGSVDLDVSEKIAEVASVKDKGAKGDGATNDNAAMLLAESEASSVYWPEGTYIVDQVPDITKSWGPGVVIVGGNRVYLRPTPTPAVCVFAEVFGGAFDGVTSDSAPLQRAIDFAQSIRLPLVFPRNKEIYLDTGLTSKQGRAASGDPFIYDTDIDLNGCTIYPGNGVLALDIVPRCLLADASTNGSGNIRLIGNAATFDGSKGNASSKALRIGKTGYFLSPFIFGVVNDILIHLFDPTTVVLDMVEARHINPVNVVVRAGITRILSQAPGSFCGDQTWTACEFTGSGGNRCLYLNANNSTGSGASAAVRGIRFDSCVTYGPNAGIEAGARGDVGDIWLNGHQFEGPYDGSVGGRGLDIIASGTSARVFAIYLSSPYFSGLKGPAVYARTASGGDIRALHITDPDCAAFTISAATQFDGNCNALFAFIGISGFTLSGGAFNSITGDTNTLVANIQNTTNFAFGPSNGANFTNVNAGVIIGGTSDRGSVIGNLLPITSTNIAANFGSGTQFVIANNLKVT